MLKKIFAKKIIWVILVVVMIGGGYFIYQKFFVKKELPYFWVEAVYGDIKEIVSETGTVKATEEINLNFNNGGTIKEIRVKVGEAVKSGDVLVVLDTTDLELRLKEAESGRDAAVAKLRSLLAGAPTEDIKVYETALRNAEKNLENLEKSTAAEIANAQKSLEAAEQAVSNAEVAFFDAQRNLENVRKSTENNLIDVYEKAKITMQSNLVTMSTALGDIDNILGIDDKTVNDAFEANLGVYNTQTKIDAENAYRSAKAAYEAAVVAVNRINNLEQDQIDTALPKVKDALNKISDTLYKTRIMLDNSLVSMTLTLTDLNNKKAIINADRQSINADLSSLQTNEQSIESTKLTNQLNIDSAQTQVNVAEANLKTAIKNREAAENNLIYIQTKTAAELVAARGQVQTAKDQLVLKKASPKEADIAFYRAEVARTQALLELAKKQIDDAFLKAPIDGIITKLNFEVGETVLPTSTVVSLMSSNHFQIEADVSELDINKIKLNDQAEVSFDAISTEQIFKGQVVTIDPAEKIKDGDIYYRVVIILDEENVPIRSGMTANIDIITNSKTNVLLIPKRAVIKEGNIEKVRVLTNGQIKMLEIKTGLEGEDMVEVLSGIKAGDKVITFIKD